jgi:hypothetical protein
MGVETDCSLSLSEAVSLKGSTPQKRVANLWTESAAHRSDASIANGKEPQNPSKLVVAATFEKANTYVFASRLIMNPTL